MWFSNPSSTVTPPEPPIERGPTLDDDEDDDRGVEGVDYADLLQAFDDENDLDDTEASDLDAAIDLDEPSDDAAEDAPAELDLGALVDDVLADDSEPDDETGPQNDDLSIGIGPPGELDDDGEDDPVDFGQITSEPLPPLESDADDAGEGAGESELLIDVEGDEIPAPSEPWPVLGLDLPPGPMRGVCVCRDGVIIIGRGAMLCDRSGQLEELANTSATLASIVPAQSAIFATTLTGEVLRLENGTAQTDRQWRTSAGLAADQAVDVWAVGDEHHVRIWSSNGVLLDYDPALDGYRRVSVEGRVLAVSRARPSWLVIQTPDGPTLMQESDRGALAGADAIGATSLLGEGCLIEAAHGVVVVARPGHGAAVSTNGGQRFSMLPGLARVTAIAVGGLPDDPQVFVGTYNATGNSAKLYRVDPIRLAVRELAEVRAADEDDDAAVTGLAFDDAERSLWAVGGFGVRVLTRPD